MALAALAVYPNIYAFEFQKCKPAVYLLRGQLPTKAISVAICFGKSSTFRPFLPLKHYTRLCLGVNLGLTALDIPHLLAWEIFPFF